MKKNVVSAIIASAVLASGTVALAAYTYLKKGQGEAPAEEKPEEAGEKEIEETEKTEETESEEAIEDAEEAADDIPEEQPAVDLETYLQQHPEEEESLNAVKDSFTADGVRTDIAVTGNTMFFDFVMTDVDDEDTKEALKPDLESFLNEQSESYSDIVDTIEEETGIEGVKMIVIFMDAEENEIVSGHYDSEGRVL